MSHLENNMILDYLRKRFSARKFQDRPIPTEVVQDILEAGRLSPSGGNEQAWAFGVVTEPGLIAQVAEIAHQQDWIAGAPLLVVLCVVPVSDEDGGRDIQLQRYPEYAAEIAAMEPNLYWALNQEEHQTKIAGTHMALVALEHGVGSCWVSRFAVKRMAKLLNLPESHIPAEILVFGYPERNLKPLKKKELTELVFYNRYAP
jgi:nitroreductase